MSHVETIGLRTDVICRKCCLNEDTAINYLLNWYSPHRERSLNATKIWSNRHESTSVTAEISGEPPVGDTLQPPNHPFLVFHPFPPSECQLYRWLLRNHCQSKVNESPHLRHKNFRYIFLMEAINNAIINK